MSTPAKGFGGLTRVEAKLDYQDDAGNDLLFIDLVRGQVSIGFAPVDEERKFYVQLDDTNTTSSDTAGHAAIETRADMQQASGTLLINGAGVYGTVWVSGAATHTGTITAVRGNAYGRPTAGPITGNGFLIGVYGRVRREGTANISNAAAFYADGLWDIAASGTITNYFGLYIEALNADTIAGGHLTSNWGVFQKGGGTNYFSGNISVNRALGVQNSKVEIYGDSGDTVDLLSGYLSDGTTKRFQVTGLGEVSCLRYNYAGTSVLNLAGSGSPEGVVTAAVGSTYHRTNGGAGTSFYVKESGAGSTGWIGK